ncbi:MAG: hypothetical protein BZ136_06070 [Methanosphaera sp. rholeuAM74]|nr:MAG: hypothetical protein BZ136_06070 [Methanosphaera sp. rholeuAM74]
MIKLDSPYLMIGILVLAVIASGILCSEYSSAVNNSNSILFTNGSTVTAGDALLDTQNTKKIPLTSDPANIIRPLVTGQYLTVFTSLITGCAPRDVIANDTFIESNGTVSSKLNGPGTVICDSEGKIMIQEPTSMIWGHKLPYTTAVKEGDTIKLVQNGSVIKTLKASEISNDSVPTDFVSAEELKSWANSSSDGSNITVDYYLGDFNDNRSGVYGKDNITHEFGNSSYAYMRNYTSGAPVMVYQHNATKTNISSAVSILESLPEYPTEVRAENAREFARGWNGTIIPPHSAAHGKENVTFTSIAEAEAASGSATHGVCPPGRSLRDAMLKLGNPLPVGMSNAEEAILYEYRPTIDVLVTNNGDYPVEIEMWTEGEGGGTTIYTTIHELKDNATYPDTRTNDTNESSE